MLLSSGGVVNVSEATKKYVDESAYPVLVINTLPVLDFSVESFYHASFVNINCEFIHLFKSSFHAVEEHLEVLFFYFLFNHLEIYDIYLRLVSFTLLEVALSVGRPFCFGKYCHF